MQQDNSEASKKAPERERSAAYPGITIESCIGFVSELKAKFQKTQFKREDVMTIFGRGSTAVNRDLSAAAQYGLIDKTVGTGYKLTQIAEYILKPYNEAERLDNIAECFKSPKLYSDLIGKFKGQVLPVDEVLEVILIREHDIIGKAAPQVAEMFIQNAIYAGLLNNQRVLMPTTSHDLLIPNNKNEESLAPEEVNKTDIPSIHTSAENTPSSNQSVPTIPLPQPRTLLNETNDNLEVTIRLSEKKVAQLIYPSTIKAKDIQILKMQIELLELTIDS